MKSVVHRIFSSILALLVLISTVSWTVDKHFCMGRVMDIAFFHHADRCGMEKAMALMGETASDMDCCDDESFTLKGQDDLKLTWDELDIDAQEFLTVFAYSYLELISFTSEKEVSETTYPPPLIVYDLHLLHEVFLI